MDPLSVVASSLSIADICIRLVAYLRDVQKVTATIEDELTSLIREVEALNSITATIHGTFRNEHSTLAPYGTPREKCDHLWEHVGRTLHDCETVIRKLEDTVKDVHGKKGPAVSGFRDAVHKAQKRRSRDGELRQCRDQLATYQNGLQILLTCINIQYTKGTKDDNAGSFGRLGDDLRKVDRHISSQIEVLQDMIANPEDTPPSRDSSTLSALRGLQQSVEYAASTVQVTNKHFDIPQPVSDLYTGREDALQDLKEHFIDPIGSPNQNQQMRFVIYGVGGSGKTQFCSKFAQNHRESFWGVFWVDASSVERIKQTYSVIAKLAKVEPNENAAMHWLCNLEQRWLLIIDNADDPDVPIQKYLPKGNRGHILITTRNSSHRWLGNVGPRFFEFQGLSFREANDLLLTAANQAQPWDDSCKISASSITKTLGCLVLCIVHAGAAIREGLCTLTTYLSFYERGWIRLRDEREKRGEKMDDPSDHMDVYTTWEICFERIESKAKEGSKTSQDAIQLLTTLSFLDWKNVKYDILRRALENPHIEAEHEREQAKQQPQVLSTEKLTITKRLDQYKMALLTFLLKDRGPAVLPRVIRDSNKRSNLDYHHDRLRFALNELVRLSLVMWNEEDDSFSMHPVVHKWARERPGMRLAEQAVWSEAAAMMLSSSVLIPPLRNNAKDEDYHRDVLPHVDHVQRCRQSINERIALKQQERWTTWLTTRSFMNRGRAMMMVKFSIVYMQVGNFDVAETLQVAVKSHAEKILGTSHEATRRISLALATNYYFQSRAIEAEQLQRDVLVSCLTTLGPEHVDTLRAKDMLGQTLFQRGRYSEAKEYLKEALHGLQKKLGNDHEETLSVMDNLAKTIAKFWERENMLEAYSLHSKAIEGMDNVYGKNHPRTLVAKENLVHVAYYLGGESRKEAESLITTVLEARKRKLGKEHPFTLLAMVTAAIVQCGLGKPDEAEKLILSGLPIAERNWGRDHIGTIFGYHNLGTVRICQKRYREAEEILVDVIERQRVMLAHRGEYHPDRLGAMIELAKTYRLQNNIHESIDLCNEILKGFEEISKKEHPLAKSVKKARKRMMDHVESIENGGTGEEGIAEPIDAEYNGKDIFGG